MRNSLNMKERTSPLKQEGNKNPNCTHPVHPLHRWINFNKGFNSLKVVSVCFVALIGVNICQTNDKISTSNANTLDNLLFLLSGSAVVLEQYIDFRTALESQNRKKR